MKMKDHVSFGKRKANQIKFDYPELCLGKRLDMAAAEQGFKDYAALTKMYELLGPDKSPSRVEIVTAGGKAMDSPYHANTNFWEQ